MKRIHLVKPVILIFILMLSGDVSSDDRLPEDDNDDLHSRSQLSSKTTEAEISETQNNQLISTLRQLSPSRLQNILQGLLVKNYQTSEPVKNHQDSGALTTPGHSRNTNAVIHVTTESRDDLDSSVAPNSHSGNTKNTARKLNPSNLEFLLSNKQPPHPLSQKKATNVQAVEPVTNVIIHAFDVGGPKDKLRLDSSPNGLTKVESVSEIVDALRSGAKLKSQDEEKVGNGDLFAGIEEKNPGELQKTKNDISIITEEPTTKYLHRLVSSQKTSPDPGISLPNNAVLRHHRINSDSLSQPLTITESVNDLPAQRLSTFRHHVPLDKDNADKLALKVIEEIPSLKITSEMNNGSINHIAHSSSISSKETGIKNLNSTYNTNAFLGTHSEPIVNGGMNHIYMEDLNQDTTGDTAYAKSMPKRARFSFSYDPESPIGPEMWRVLHTEWTCQGRKQSPIDIRTDQVINDTVVKNIVIKVEPEGRPLSGILRNNGHAPTFSLTEGATVKLSGATLVNEYVLRQFHFHFGCDDSKGSEHKIDGQAYPLELHLVFWDSKTFSSFTEAAKSDRGIAVVAILFHRTSIPLNQVRNTPLTQLMKVIRKIEDEGDYVKISEIFDLTIDKLIQNVMNKEQADRFFVYEGSLSTPGCYESVTWIVYDTHPDVTDSQLEIFRKLKSTKVNSQGTMCNNFRPIQRRYGRRLYSNIL